MNRFMKMLPHLIVIIIAFYLLPLLIIDTGSAMIMLLAIIPLICFINSLIYGQRAGFNLIYNILVAAIFVPTIFIFYNSTAWLYIIGFGIISLVGNVFGMMSFKLTR